jgi:hypothetical protein
MKRLLNISIVVLIILLLYSAAQAFTLPDTGQTKCYRAVDPYDEISCAGTGQDGSYSKSRSYTDSGSNVTDNVTGLEWRKCSAGQSGSDCSGGSANLYNWYQATGTSDAVYNPDSYSACSALYGSDWRLPTKKELKTLVDFGIPSPGPAINTAYFPNTLTYYDYWSSTTYASSPASAWFVDFNSGSLYYFFKENSGYVRCVRGGQAPASYTNHDNGTVTDNSTGLMWQRCSAGQNDDSTCSGDADPGNWADALTYCNNLSLGGKGDWRLPDIMELESLADDSRYDPAINTAYFPNTLSFHYWSSTTSTDQPYYAIGVFFNYGFVYLNYKNNYPYVRCVRGGQLAINDAVKIAGTENYYSTIKAAYDTDGAVKTILAQAVELGETLQFAGGKDITLIGGYDIGFDANEGFTAINGLTIGGTDKLTIDRIMIK